MNPYLILAVVITAPLIAYRVLRDRHALGLAFVAGIIAVAASVSIATVAHAQEANPNSVEYWEAFLDDGSDCFKHERWDVSVHGAVTDDSKAVTLATFDPTWEQDFWRLLVVNGGSGDTVIEFPESGVAYFPPLNNGGQQPDISHWIVCKGYDSVVPEGDEDATTTIAETVTTPGDLTPELQIITIPDLPTPSVSVTATTAPANETVCDDQPLGCTELGLDRATVTTGAILTGQLPRTGRNTDLLILAGTLMAAAGTALVIVRRRPA